jgi:gas vesicle protein
MASILSLIGVIIAAVLSLIGVIYQTKSKEKQDNIINKLSNFHKEAIDADNKILAKVDDVRMNALKRFLVSELTKIMNKDYIPNEEQKRMLKEAKDEYNKAGGDSYVDDMYDDARAKGLI